MYIQKGTSHFGDIDLIDNKGSTVLESNNYIIRFIFSTEIVDFKTFLLTKLAIWYYNRSRIFLAMSWFSNTLWFCLNDRKKKKRINSKFQKKNDFITLCFIKSVWCICNGLSNHTLSFIIISYRGSTVFYCAFVRMCIPSCFSFSLPFYPCVIYFRF